MLDILAPVVMGDARAGKECIEWRLVGLGGLRWGRRTGRKDTYCRR